MVSKTASQHLADRSPPFDVDLPLGHLVGKLGKLVLLLPQREVLVVLGAGVAECVMQEAPPAGQGRGGGDTLMTSAISAFGFTFTGSVK